MVKIPLLTITNGAIEGVELRLRDSHSFALFLQDIVLQFLLANLDEMTEQGYFMPRVGFIKWSRLFVRSDSPMNQRADIKKTVGRITAIVSQLDESIVVE